MNGQLNFVLSQIAEPEIELKEKSVFIKKRILALDGGGSRGIIMARILQYIEEKTNTPVT
jgi:patatin-like phospholipase/acyl hydrolase